MFFYVHIYCMSVGSQLDINNEEKSFCDINKMGTFCKKNVQTRWDERHSIVATHYGTAL